MTIRLTPHHCQSLYHHCDSYIFTTSLPSVIVMKVFIPLAFALTALAAPLAPKPTASAPAPSGATPNGCWFGFCGGPWGWKRDEDVSAHVARRVANEEIRGLKGPSPTTAAPSATSSTAPPSTSGASPDGCWFGFCGGPWGWKRDEDLPAHAARLVANEEVRGLKGPSPTTAAPSSTASAAPPASSGASPDGCWFGFCGGPWGWKR